MGRRLSGSWQPRSSEMEGRPFPCRPSMADNQNIAAKIKWFRGRAEEVRVTAEGMNNPLARGAMLQMSQTYERLAESLELVLERQKRNDVG